MSITARASQSSSVTPNMTPTFRRIGKPRTVNVDFARPAAGLILDGSILKFTNYMVENRLNCCGPLFIFSR